MIRVSRIRLSSCHNSDSLSIIAMSSNRKKIPSSQDLVILVGLGHHSNSRSCSKHRGGCGIHHLMMAENLGVGTVVQAVWLADAEFLDEARREHLLGLLALAFEVTIHLRSFETHTV